MDSLWLTLDAMAHSKETNGNGSESGGSVNINEKGVNTRALVTVDESDALRSADPVADKVWRLYAGGKSTREIGQLFNKSHTWAWALIVSRTEELREAVSPEHKAACRGVMIDRCNEIYGIFIDLLRNYDPESCKGSSQQGIGAVCLKSVEILGRIHNVGGDDTGVPVVDTGRMEEVARRLLLSGPHSKAGRTASRQAMDMAGVKEADAREVKGDN